MASSRIRRGAASPGLRPGRPSPSPAPLIIGYRLCTSQSDDVLANCVARPLHHFVLEQTFGDPAGLGGGAPRCQKCAYAHFCQHRRTLESFSQGSWSPSFSRCSASGPNSDGPGVRRKASCTLTGGAGAPTPLVLFGMVVILAEPALCGFSRWSKPTKMPRSQILRNLSSRVGELKVPLFGTCFNTPPCSFLVVLVKTTRSLATTLRGG